jgi:glyoxylase-like metal-dependent hydrolase (beta-lactamase superfamily II)
VVTGIVPAINDGDSRQLQSTLEALQQLDARVLVPGHGPVLCGADAVREHLAWTVGYLSRLRALVAEALTRGIPSEQVPDEADYATFVGDRLPLEPFNMLRRHRMVVARMTAELEDARRV